MGVQEQGFEQLLWLLPAGVGAMFVLVGGILIVSAWRTVHRSRTWPRVTGELISATQERRVSDSSSDGSSTTRYVLVAHYRYRHPQTGAVVEGRNDVPSGTVVSPEHPVELAYDPQDASRSIFPEPGLAGASCLTAFAGIFVVMGLLVLGVTAVVMAR